MKFSITTIVWRNSYLSKRGLDNALCKGQQIGSQHHDVLNRMLNSAHLFW